MGNHSVADADLLFGIADGRKAPFDALFQRHEIALRTHIRRIVRDDEVAGDILQEVFLRVWVRSDTWNGSGSVAGWLHRIATNLSLNYLRSVRRRREQPLPEVIADMDGEENDSRACRELESTLPGPDTAFERRQMELMLKRFVEELPDAKRQVLQAVYEEDMSVKQVSASLGIADGTVKSRLYYGRREVARRVNEQN